MLQETVDSILNQTYPRFELLVIDNESTDDTEKYVKSLLDERVRYLRHANGGILSVNRNFGIAQAKGEYVSFCDDDDLWEPSKLEVQLQFLNKHPDYKIICTNGLYFSEKGIYGQLIKRKKDGEITLDDFLRGRNDVIISSSLISKAIFSDIGLFNEDPDIVNIEDYELWVRAVKKHKMYFINQCLVKYRVHEAMTSHKDTRKTMAKLKVMLNKLFENNTLTKEQYEKVKKNLEIRDKQASIKEAFKKFKIIKNAVYLNRKLRHSLDSKIKRH